MDNVVLAKADSMFRLILGRSDDQVFHVKVTNSRTRQVNDRLALETMLHRTLQLVTKPDGRVLPWS